MFTVMELGDGSASQWAHRHSADPSPLLPCPTQSVPADSRHCNWLGSAEAVAANKVKLLESIKALGPRLEPRGAPTACSHSNRSMLTPHGAGLAPLAAMDDAVLGQFEGYLADDTVPEGSVCPTYAAVSIAVDNERWAGVPMMITAGGFLDKPGAVHLGLRCVGIRSTLSWRWVLGFAGKGLSERTCTVEVTQRPAAVGFQLPIRCLIRYLQPHPVLRIATASGSQSAIPFPQAAFKPGLPYKSLLLRVQPDPGLWLVGPKGSVELPFMEAMPGTGD